MVCTARTGILMPPRTRRTPPAPVQSPEPPAVGHNSDLSDDALIAENHKINDLVKAAQVKFDEWAKPHKERLKEIEDILFKRLVERGADSTRTDSGTAYISNLSSVKIEDTEKLFDFAADRWTDYGAEIKLSIGIKAVRQYMDDN